MSQETINANLEQLAKVLEEMRRFVGDAQKTSDAPELKRTLQHLKTDCRITWGLILDSINEMKPPTSKTTRRKTKRRK